MMPIHSAIPQVHKHLFRPRPHPRPKRLRAKSLRRETRNIALQPRQGRRNANQRRSMNRTRMSIIPRQRSNAPLQRQKLPGTILQRPLQMREKALLLIPNQLCRKIKSKRAQTRIRKVTCLWSLTRSQNGKVRPKNRSLGPQNRGPTRCQNLMQLKKQTINQ